MPDKLLINSGQSGVVYDHEGHTLGGGERLPLTEALDAVGEAAVDRGHLVLLPAPETPSDGASSPE